MKSLVLILSFVIVCVNAHYPTVFEDSPADQIKDHPGKCYVENHGLIEKGEEVKVNGKCQKALCLEEGKYQLTKCNYLAVEPPCYAVYPTDKPFPECCTFKIECMKTPRPPTPRTPNI